MSGPLMHSSVNPISEEGLARSGCENQSPHRADLRNLPKHSRQG